MVAKKRILGGVKQVVVDKKSDGDEIYVVVNKIALELKVRKIMWLWGKGNNSCHPS